MAFMFMTATTDKHSNYCEEKEISKINNEKVMVLTLVQLLSIIIYQKIATNNTINGKT